MQGGAGRRVGGAAVTIRLGHAFVCVARVLAPAALYATADCAERTLPTEFAQTVKPAVRGNPA